MFKKYILIVLNYIIKRSLIFSVLVFSLGLGCGYMFNEANDYKTSIFKIQNSIVTCFTPPKGCASLIEETILSAKKTIYIQAYSFTHPGIINAIIAQANKGIDIVIILDKSNLTNNYSGWKKCIEAGIKVYFDTVFAIAHNKIIITDVDTENSKLITGSFNFSKAADTKNAENVLLIQQSDIVNIYYNNFENRLNSSLHYLEYLKKYNNKIKKNKYK